MDLSSWDPDQLALEDPKTPDTNTASMLTDTMKLYPKSLKKLENQ